MTEGAEPAAVAKRITELPDFWERVRGPQGDKGADADPSHVAMHLKADDGFRASLRGPEGVPGKDADVETVAKRVMSDADFREKLRPPSVEDVTKRLMDDENFLLAIAGKDGEAGKDGQSVTKEMVSEAVKLEMEDRWDEITAMIPEPEKGDKGEDADPEAVATALLGSKEFLSRTRGPEGPAGKSV